MKAGQPQNARSEGGSHKRGIVVITFLAAAAVLLGVSGALAQTPDPQIDCTVEVTYGEPIVCSTSGVDEEKTSIDWGDGTSTPTSTSAHSPKAVGAVIIALVAEDGRILASSTSKISPDLVLSCETAETADVYELAASSTAESGWDYVYIETATGTQILPGDAGYPSGFDLTGFERVQSGQADVTGKCTATSQAGEDLDGDFSMTMTSEWEEARSVPFGYIVPWTSHHWAGTQPGELEATVTIDGLEASERIGIYFAGCG